MQLRPALTILFFFLFTALFIFMTGFLTPVISKDGLEVTRDKDKTTYSIGPSEKRKNEKTEEEKDKERAWDMLKNMNIIIDKEDKRDKRTNNRVVNRMDKGKIIIKETYLPRLG